MTRKRQPTDEELALWDAVARTVRPLRKAKSGAIAVPRPPVPGRRKGPEPAPKAPRMAVPEGPGPIAARARLTAVDGRTAEKLRRGRIEPDGRIDLHGMSQADAYAALATFVRRHAGRGARLLLVITGRGGGREAPAPEPGDRFVMPERPKGGILRAIVPHWLAAPPLAADVVGVQAAHRRHGGSGAIYVYLRRKREGP